MPVSNDDIAANMRRICAALREAAIAGADVLLTPEGALSGYRPDCDEPLARAALGQITTEAKQSGVGLALGICFREDDGKCYNQLRFYRANGDYLGFHAKTLLCGRVLAPGSDDEINHYATRELRTFEWAPGLRIGGLICNDVWANPEYTPKPDIHLVQQLAARGVRVIFHAVNGGRDAREWSRVNWRYHEANLRLRARAGAVWIVTVDNAFPENLDCASPSGVVAPDGSWACRAEPRGAQIFAHTVDLEPSASRVTA
jgi:predicted amidohydrolase